MGFIKESVYIILEKLFGKHGLSKRIHDVRLRLPVRYINYFPSDYEQENFSFLKKYLPEAAVILDIGAHIGVFAVIAAKYAGNKGRVFAFEPAGVTNQLLKKTIAMNGLENVVIPFLSAMGEAPGKTVFYVSDIEGDNSNSLIAYKSDRQLNAVEVDVFSVDSFVKEQNIKAVHFIKIDVEGAEYDALMGARSVLSTLRPICILAIHPEPILTKGDSLEKIYDLIKEMGYAVYYKNESIGKDTFCKNRALIDLHLLPA